MRQLSREVDDLLQGEDEETSGLGRTQEKDIIRDVFDISSTLNDAASALVDDSFLRCFNSAPDDPWNWNVYLFPLWVVGVVRRHCILFPLRLVALLLGGFSSFGHHILISPGSFPRGAPERAERASVHFLAQASSRPGRRSCGTTAPARAPPGPRLGRQPHEHDRLHAAVARTRPSPPSCSCTRGGSASSRRDALSGLGCLWFNRRRCGTGPWSPSACETTWQTPDARSSSSRRGPASTTGTASCSSGARSTWAPGLPHRHQVRPRLRRRLLELEATDFSRHLFKLMRSWALVADVWFLEPQQRREGETATAFASRVQTMIADKAGLKIAPWDGYLKYYNIRGKVPRDGGEATKDVRRPAEEVDPRIATLGYA